MQFLTFFGFTLIVAFISYIATRKVKELSSDSYFLGGRGLTVGLIAGSLLLTNLSTKQIVGINGSAYESGLFVMVTENPENFNSIGGKTDPVPFYMNFTGMMLKQLFNWSTNQQNTQHVLVAKNLNDYILEFDSLKKVLFNQASIIIRMVHSFTPNLFSTDNHYLNDYFVLHDKKVNFKVPTYYIKFNNSNYIDNSRIFH
jgi:uncharacterized sodium:solute symporter family permease YidK